MKKANLTYRVAYAGSEDARVLARLAITHQLFISGWRLVAELLNTYSTREGSICIACAEYPVSDLSVGLKRELVGCTLLTKNDKIMAFVKPDWRMRGIGREMVKRLNVPDFVGYSEGEAGSLTFWQNVLGSEEKDGQSTQTYQGVS